jgi:hypothetical protein
LVLVLSCLSLAGCGAPASSGSGGSSAKDTAIPVGRTPTESAYFAAKAAQEASEEDIGYAEYDPSADSLELYVNADSQPLFDAIAGPSDGKRISVSIDLVRGFRPTDAQWSRYSYLSAIPCSSLIVDTRGAAAPVSAAELGPLAGVSCPVTLAVGHELVLADTPALESLERLIIDLTLVPELSRGSSFWYSLAGLDAQPKVETLWIVPNKRQSTGSKGQVSPNFSVSYDSVAVFAGCLALREVRFAASANEALATLNGSSWKDPTAVSLQDVNVMDAARSCPTMETIQGRPAAEFSIESYDQFQYGTDLEFGEWREAYLDFYQTLDNTGTAARIDDKVYVSSYGYTSEHRLGGDRLDASAYGVPVDRIAVSPNDCHHLVMIKFRKGDLYGTYSDGSDGYQGVTSVVVVDVRAESYSEIDVAITNPPDSTWTTGGGVHFGPVDEAAAFAFIATLL